MKENTGLYSRFQVAFSAIVCTPVAAGFLFRRNMINLGKRTTGNIVFFFSILAVTTCLTLLFALPEDDSNIVSFSGIGIYIFFVFLFDKLQKKDIKEYRAYDGKLYTWVRAIAVSLITLSIYIFILSPVILFLFP